MNNKLKILMTAACFAATAVSAGFAARGWLRAREMDGQRMTISATSRALEARLREDDSKANAERKRQEEAKKQPRFNIDEALEKMISENPVLQNKRLAAFRAEVLNSYGPFFQKMNLTPEQKSRLLDALAQRQAYKEISGGSFLVPVGTSKEAIDALMKANKKSFDAFESVAVSVLGEEGTAQLEAYQQDMRMWDYVGNLAATAALSGIPISLQQADRLVALMSSAPSTPKQGPRFGMPKTQADWAAIDEQAKTFLSKEQWDMFRSVEPRGGGRFQAQFSNEMHQAVNDADSEEQ